MKPIPLLALFFSALSLDAQKTVDITSGDVNVMNPMLFKIVAGEPFASVRFAKLVSGTPYFAEDWMKGSITIDGGKQYAGLYIKLDLYDNQMHYRDEKGAEVVATTTIQNIKLEDTTKNLVFSFVNAPFIETKDPVSGWYQLLASGKIYLFKKFIKQIDENTPYGSATVEQTMTTKEKYYVLMDRNFKEIKKIKDLTDLMGDKKDAVSQFIKSKNISGKSDEDFEAVINYANSLN